MLTRPLSGSAALFRYARCMKGRRWFSWRRSPPLDWPSSLLSGAPAAGTMRQWGVPVPRLLLGRPGKARAERRGARAKNGEGEMLPELRKSAHPRPGRIL